VIKAGWGVFKRSQQPPTLSNYQGYKPFLRIDFLQRCAYCRITEQRWGSHRNFVVEHFRPKSRKEFSHLLYTYSNLYYACNRCNDFKGTTWPTKSLERRGYYFADPCVCSMYTEHLKIMPDGRLKTLTKCGEYCRDHLHLDRALLVRWRAEGLKLFRDMRAADKAISILERQLTPRISEQAQQTLRRLIEDYRRVCDRLSHEY
jgi:hypothetical protein